jgi:hypothetical protein
MNAFRWTFAAGILALGIVVAGIGVGAVAYFGGEGVKAQTGSMGPSLVFIPRGASLIGYVDLKAVASSPLAESWSQEARERTPLAALDEIRESTGVDVLNEVDALTFATGPGPGKPERWGVAVTGAFDPDRLLEKLARHPGGVETSAYGGTDLHVMKTKAGSTAMALPDDATLIFGDAAYVREMLDAGSGRKPSATGSLESWGYGDFAEETFWLAGAPPDVVSGLVGQGTEKTSLRSFAVTGRLDSDLLLRARGKAKDPKTAEELADVVRGLVALGRLRQDSSQESAVLGEMAESVRVELADDGIDVSLQVPYDSIHQLLSSQQKESTPR